MVTIRNTRDDTRSATILLYGPPGAGKTTFASSFPRPLVLDFDGGLRSVARAEVDYIDCMNAEQPRDVLRVVESRLADYDTVVRPEVGSLPTHLPDTRRPELARQSTNRRIQTTEALTPSAIERTWPQGLPFWPLLRVTNDITQQITVITPQ